MSSEIALTLAHVIGYLQANLRLKEARILRGFLNGTIIKQINGKDSGSCH